MTDGTEPSGRSAGFAPSSVSAGVGPDPTTRTVEALYREVDHLKELMTNRNLAYDKAIELLQARQDRQPQPVENKMAIEALESVMLEKFKSVDIRFTDTLSRADESSRASKTAVDAAFQSSGQAIAKNETTTNKQLDQLAATILATTKALEDRHSDLKDRLTVIESLDRGRGVERTDTRSGQQMILAAVGGLLALLGIIAFFNAPRQAAAPPIVVESSRP